MSHDEAKKLRAIVHGVLLAPSPLSRYWPGPSRRALHGAVALFSTGGGPGADYNFVFVIDPVDPERVFALADAFFAPAEVWSVAIEVGVAPAVEAALLARGWSLDEEEPALVLVEAPPIPPTPAELAIRPVRDERGLADFYAVSRTTPHFVPSLAAAMDPEVALFVGYCDDRAVATSRLACLGGVAEITGVGTLPEYRKRGFGTAMTWATVAEAATRGCTTTMLNASPLGYPIYRRMGFVPVGTYRTYLLPEEHAE